MKIYILDADVGKYRPIYYTDEDDIVEFIRRFNGTPMRNIWKAEEKFAFVPRRMIKGDTPGLNTHIPVFSVKAAKALEDFLKPNGELLPIICDGERYFVFNVTKVVDALDEANCELKLFNDGDIMDIIRFEFFQALRVSSYLCCKKKRDMISAFLAL